MNETKKTGIFCVVALAMVGAAAVVAWPRPTTVGEDTLIGQDLFQGFTDPLSAASLKIVTYDENQGELETFEVRRDGQSGLWTIPSLDGYPADALDQMTTAANALIGLKTLDIQTSNAEDHADLGVAEPKLEELDIGDEGVGRLVTFKDESQNTLASIIIGDPEKADPEKRYVRIPGQDPVYVVKLDEAPLTTKFRDWIEADLLDLSSIDIDSIEIKDYNASVSRGVVSLKKNYDAKVQAEGSDWKVVELAEYEPGSDQPTPVELADDVKLNKPKLDDMKNALDDLEIVGVTRKPEGMSANLKADESLLSDQNAVDSLAGNGFLPARRSTGEIEILSANGELTATTKEGVKYVMRFGNVSSVDMGDDGGEGESTDAGVNRYLLVTCVVDEMDFPVPELKKVPETLEELDAILNPPIKAQPADTPTENEAETEASELSLPDSPDADSPDAGDGENATKAAENETPAEDASEPELEGETETPAADASEPELEGETETSGGGEASGSGQALAAAQDESETTDDSEASTDEDAAPSDEASAPADEASAEQSSEPAPSPEGTENDASDDEKMSQEELLELLDAEAEKVQKENQRKLDERNDKIEAAKRRAAELNARFADWYYVIAEDTYSKLRISRDELFEKTDDETAGSEESAAQPPAFPGGFETP